MKKLVLTVTATIWVESDVGELKYTALASELQMRSQRWEEALRNAFPPALRSASDFSTKVTRGNE